MLVYTRLVGLVWLAIAASLIDGTPPSGVSALPTRAVQIHQQHDLKQLNKRFTNPRIGIVLQQANTSFPDTSGSNKVPLKRMDLPEGTDALLAFQHHVNKANARLAKRNGLPEGAGRLDAVEGAALRRRSLQNQQAGAMSPTRLSADNTLDEPQKRLLSQMQTANEEVVREGPVRLSKRKLLFKHGRVGIVMKDPSTNAATASMAKRLFGGLLDGLLSGGSSSGAGQPSQTALPPLQPSSAVMPMADNSTVIGQPQNKQAPASYASGGYPKADLAAAISGGLQSASPPVSQGSLGLNIEANDVGYVATIRIGSAQTPFRMLIDSGSADTWVASTACQQCGNDHQKLGTEVSTSFQHLAGSSFSITYGTGAVRGALGSDNINVAGMTLQNHTLGLATQETTDFSDPSVPFDGLMGLAKTELSNSNTPTPIDALYQAGLVTAPVMGYHLGRVADGTNSGEVTFGAVDAQKYQGTLLEIPNVSTKGFWEAAVTGVSYAGRDLGLTGRTAILDTGTSLIVAPQADADAVHAAIPGSHADGQGGYTIPCTTTGVFAFKFQGQTFGIDPRDMTFLPVDQNNRKGDCVSAISAGIVGDPNEWLVGAAFLKNVYFATNARDNMIGIARLAP